MKLHKTIIIFLMLPLFFYGQKQDIEIYGKISGESKNKIYLFFENDFKKGDSLSATVNNGNFYFKLRAVLPVLCRIHFLENSQIQEFYIDNVKTSLILSSKLTDRDIPDSLGGPVTKFDIIKVRGSSTQQIIQSFKKWRLQLDSQQIAVERKRQIHYEKVRSIVGKYPKSKASAYIIAGGLHFRGDSFGIGEDLPLNYLQIRNLFDMLDSSLLHTMEWANLSNLLLKMNIRRNRIVGNQFNDVILKDTSGNSVDTKQFRNKVVLIDFWASWCKPCRALNPELHTLYSKYKDRGFEIIGISTDSDQKSWRNAIVQDSLEWTQLNQGRDGALSRYYDIESIPTKVLLDANGKILGFNQSIEEIEKVLNTNL